MKTFTLKQNAVRDARKTLDNNEAMPGRHFDLALVPDAKGATVWAWSPLAPAAPAAPVVETDTGGWTTWTPPANEGTPPTAADDRAFESFWSAPVAPAADEAPVELLLDRKAGTIRRLTKAEKATTAKAAKAAAKPAKAPTAAKAAKPAKAPAKAAKPAKAAPAAPAAAAPKAGTKADTLVARLREEGGAAAVDLQREFGWLPHTLRGAISTLGKKLGVTVESFRSEQGVRFYRLPPAA